MPTPLVIGHFDVVKQLAFGIAVTGELLHNLVLDGREEGFHHGVVVAVPATAHTARMPCALSFAKTGAAVDARPICNPRQSESDAHDTGHNLSVSRRHDRDPREHGLPITKARLRMLVGRFPPIVCVSHACRRRVVRQAARPS
jgi:hypothetical protein